MRAVPGAGYPFFFLLLVGVCLSLSLPIKQHMGYIFSKIRLSLAAPYRFWKRIDEFRRKRGFFCLCVCLCFVCLFCFRALGIHSLPGGYRICKCICSSTVDVGSSISTVEFAPPMVLALSVRTAVFSPVGTISSCGVRDTGFTALYKYDHLLAPTYLCSPSFSAHLNCPICLTWSINVNCLHLKLTLLAFRMCRSWILITSADGQRAGLKVALEQGVTFSLSLPHPHPQKC